MGEMDGLRDRNHWVSLLWDLEPAIEARLPVAAVIDARRRQPP